MHLISAGEILWDLIDGAEYLGGAVFNFSTQLTRLGHRVSFVSGVGDDERGRRALATARKLGLPVQFIKTVPGAETGSVSVTVDAGGQPSYVIHRPAAYDFAALDETDFRSLALPAPDWIAFGTLVSMSDCALGLLRTLFDRFPGARRFYDINLRHDSFTPELVESLCELAQVVKLNEAEVDVVGRMFGTKKDTLEVFCREYSARFGWQAVCVTRGSEGCALLLGDEYIEAPGYRVAVADTVGAGDAFAAGLVHGIHSGWRAREVADFANRLGALVASLHGGTPAWTIAELQALQ